MSQEQWIPIVVVIVVGYVGWFLTAITLYRIRRKMDIQEEDTKTFPKKIGQR